MAKGRKVCPLRSAEFEADGKEMYELAERLVCEGRLSAPEYLALLTQCDDSTWFFLRHEAVRTAQERFGCAIFVRGLIEISSYCRNDCRYCGLRRSNRAAERYRLIPEQILAACEAGFEAGFRTFVLQGGEDPWWSDERLVPLVEEIHRRWPEAAITLSLGERSEASYRALHEAGAARYLLRHEAADRSLYEQLHPTEMSHAGRLACIEQLKAIGFQTGMGMMVGAPGQRVEHLVEDLLLLERIEPQMIGIGPFLPHRDTPYGAEPAGDLRLTLLLLAILRLRFPQALIPSTTALATLHPEGRLQGILSGANVVMPNLSPESVRSKYAIYDGKASSGAEAAEGLRLLAEELRGIGYGIDFSRGDYQR